MPVDVLEQGPEPSAARSRARAPALVLGALAVVVAGALQVRGQPPAQEVEPPPRELLERAGVLSVEPARGGVLHVRAEVVGAPRAALLSAAVEVPGSDVVLLPTPNRLTDDGAGLLVLDVLPRCPSAVAGLAQAEVRAVVRARQGAPAQQVRVALDTSGELADAVRARCGAVRPRLRTSAVALDGPVGEQLATRLDVSASDAGPVSVVAVRPGPGLTASTRTPLPVQLSPGDPPVVLRVALRRGACGGAPDTPPYVVVLSTGDVVAPRVAPEVVAPLDALRPFPCGT